MENLKYRTQPNITVKVDVPGNLLFTPIIMPQLPKQNKYLSFTSPDYYYYACVYKLTEGTIAWMLYYTQV
jgi:hypothetical protein